MSDDFDWAKDDAYMLAEFHKREAEEHARLQQDPAFLAYQESLFQEAYAVWAEDQDGPVTEEDYTDYLLRGVEE